MPRPHLNRIAKNNCIPKHGGNIVDEANRLGVQVDKLLDASTSVVPFPPPRSLQNQLAKYLQQKCLRNYPDCAYKELRQSISTFHGIQPEMVLPGNGASELLTWAARDAAKEGLNCLPVPGFADYERAINCWEGSYKKMQIPLTWTSQMPQAFPILPKSNVIWITNPHNPTGQLWSKQSLEPLLKNYNLVICDEAFLPLVPDGENQSLLPLVSSNKNLIVIRSLTKLFAIAGLRLGYVIADEERIRDWQLLRDPWAVNSLANYTGITIMNDRKSLNKWTKTIHQWVRKEGAWLYSRLENIPNIKAHPSAANYILIEGKDSLLTLREELAKKRILIRDCRSFKELGENWLRIGLQTRKNNNRIVKSIKKIMSSASQ